MPRERHQNGWVVLAGKRVKKWIGHWRPYREDGSRGHSTVVLGLKSKLAKWEAEEKLRAHIAAQEKRPVIPDGESTFPWFWVHRFLPTRTWCPKTESLIRRIFELHVLPVIGARPLREIEKFELDVLVKKLAAHWSGSLVHKVRTYTKAAFEEAIDQGLLDRNPARKIARPATRASCRRFLSLDEITRLLDARDDRERLIARICIILGLRCSLCGGTISIRRPDACASTRQRWIRGSRRPRHLGHAPGFGSRDRSHRNSSGGARRVHPR